jgi:hypothetical protein
MKWVSILKELLAAIAEGFFKSLWARKDKQEVIDDQEDFDEALSNKDPDTTRDMLDDLVRQPKKKPDE